MSSVDHDALRDVLVDEGKAMLQWPVSFVHFTGNQKGAPKEAPSGTVAHDLTFSSRGQQKGVNCT